MNVKASVFILFVFITAQVLTACGSVVSAATAIPTVMSTPTSDPLQAAKIVQAFWDALAAGNLETAIAYVDDNANCRAIWKPVI